MNDDTKAMLKGTVIMVLGFFAMAAYVEAAAGNLVQLIVAAGVFLVFVSMPWVWPRLEPSQR